MPQFVAGMQGGFGRMIGVQHVQFRHQFDRHDLFATGFIDKQVAGDLEQIGFSRCRAGHVAIGKGARHTFGD